MTYKQLVQTLQEHSNKKFDDFNNTIIKSGVPTVGCTLPFVRSLAKLCTLHEVENFPIHSYYEVDLLRGIVIANCKLTFTEKEAHLSDFARTIENWAVCDASVIKVPKSEREPYFNFFCSMLLSEETFVCRYGVVNLLGNFLDEEYIDGVFGNLDKIKLWGNYYVDMAVAWLVATAMAKCRDKTVEFMENNGRRVLGKSAYNKSLQKMRDSFRVSDADKQWTRTMKLI